MFGEVSRPRSHKRGKQISHLLVSNYNLSNREYWNLEYLITEIAILSLKDGMVCDNRGSWDLGRWIIVLIKKGIKVLIL